MTDIPDNNHVLGIHDELYDGDNSEFFTPQYP